MPTVYLDGPSKLALLAAAAIAAATVTGNAAHASALEQVAWTLANQSTATSAYSPPADRSYNSTGGSITVEHTDTGNYVVTFAGFESTPVHDDDVQVTAYDGSGYCNVGGWSTGNAIDVLRHSADPITASNVSIFVNCYAAGGAFSDSQFTVLYQKRKGPFGSAAKAIAFLLADKPTSSRYTPDTAYQYNSTGGINTMTRSGPGSYSAFLPGLTQPGGQVQITAHDVEASWADISAAEIGGRCNVKSWNSNTSGTTVNIECVNASGVAADQYFDLAYSIGTTLGHVDSTTPGVYARASKDTKPTYNPNPTYAYNGLTSGKLTIQRTGVGVYNVTVPGSPHYSSWLVLVTGYKTGGGYCNGLGFAGTIVYVDCYGAAGTPADADFDMTFQTWVSRPGIGLH